MDRFPPPHKVEDIEVTNPYGFGTFVVSFPLKSELDVTKQALFGEVLDKAIEDPDCVDIVIDFNNIDFMDSTGIKMLIDAYMHYKTLKQGIERPLVLDFRGKASRQAYRILQVTGLVDYFEILGPD